MLAFKLKLYFSDPKIFENNVKSDDYLNSDKMKLRTYPDQLKAWVEWDHKGQEKKKGELYRITPTYSPLS